MLSSSLDLDVLLTNIIEFVVPTMADWCSLDFHPDRPDIRHVSVAHRHAEQAELARQMEHGAAKEPSEQLYSPELFAGHSVLIPEVPPEMFRPTGASNEYLDALAAIGARSVLQIPLSSDDGIYAFMSLAMAESGRAYNEDDRNTVEELGRQCELAIENATRFGEAQKVVQEREDSLALLESIVGGGEIGMAFLDMNLRFRFLNDELASVGGPKTVMPVGRTIPQVLPLFADTLLPVLQRVAAGVQLAQEVELSGRSFREPDFLQSWRAHVYLVRDQQQEAIGVGLIVIDITERKEAELARERSESQLRLALEASRMGLWQWNPPEGTTRWSESASILIGVDPLEPTSFDIFINTVHEEDRDNLLAAIDVTMSTGAPFDQEFRVVWPDGTIHWILLKGQAQQSNDAIIGMTGIALDATERRLNQDEEERLALRQLRAGEQAIRMQRVTSKLSEAVTVSEVCEVVIHEGSAVVIGHPRCAIALVSEDGQSLDTKHYLGYTDDQMRGWNHIELSTAGLPMSEAVRTGRPVLVNDAETLIKDYPAIGEFIKTTGTAAVAIFPLIVSGRALGAWVFTWPERRDFEEGELIILLTLASQSAQAVERARLYERERFISTALQRTLLPQNLPDLNGATTAQRYQPSAVGVEVGGDWYDVIRLPDNRVALVIGDVGGHDIDAAAVMGQLRNAIRSYAWEGHPAGKVVEATNRLLCGLEPGVFATCCYVELNLGDGIASVALAGHPPPLVVREHETASFMEIAADPPLGTSPDFRYDQTSLFLESGNTIVLYTDGLIESRHLPVTKGLARLSEAATMHSSEDAETLIDSLLNVTDPDSQEDDLALLVLRYEPIGAVGKSSVRSIRRSLPSTPESAGDARRFASDVFTDWGANDVVDAVGLCVSELVTNALIHTATDIEIILELSEAYVRVEVLDQSERMPVVQRRGDEATSGRGLQIVDAVASEWGVEPNGSGKNVWFRVDRNQSVVESR